jgi:hypothetical protein
MQQTADALSSASAPEESTQAEPAAKSKLQGPLTPSMAIKTTVSKRRKNPTKQSPNFPSRRKPTEVTEQAFLFFGRLAPFPSRNYQLFGPSISSPRSPIPASNSPMRLCSASPVELKMRGRELLSRCGVSILTASYANDFDLH